jgi:hypothetical protein
MDTQTTTSAGLDIDAVADRVLPQPVAALTAMRRQAGTTGTVLIADLKAAPRFTAPGDELERLLYGFSLLICLPDSMSTPGSAATGTLLRPEALREPLTAGPAALARPPSRRIDSRSHLGEYAGNLAIGDHFCVPPGQR